MSILRARLILAAASLAACGACTRKSPDERKAEVRQEAEKGVARERETIGEIRTDAAEKAAKIDVDAAKKDRDAFLKDAKERLSRLGDRIDELDKRVDKQGDAVKVVANTQLAEARGRQAEVKALLHDLGDEDKVSSWQQLKVDVDHKLADLDTRLARVDETMTAH